MSAATAVNLTDTERMLLRSACAARSNAHAPYSRFSVGAAVLASDGRVFSGCNVENASSGLTICAERNAVAAAVAAGIRPGMLKLLALAAAPQAAASPAGPQKAQPASPTGDPQPPGFLQAPGGFSAQQTGFAPAGSGPAKPSPAAPAPAAPGRIAAPADFALPCGACLQVLAEFADAGLGIIVLGAALSRKLAADAAAAIGPQDVQRWTLGQLLPQPFRL